MKTKDKAIQEFKKFWPGWSGYVYQFPKGHWGTCTYLADIANNLRNNDEIYPGVPAAQWMHI